MLFAFAFAAFAFKINSPRTSAFVKPVFDSTGVVITPPKDEPPPPPEKKIEPKPIQTDRVTPPVFVPRDSVRDEDGVVDPEEVVNVGTETVKGERIELPTTPPTYVDSGKVIEIVREEPKPVEDKIYNKVEIEARFNGNFRDFLEKNLKYPDGAAENGEEGTIVVEFVIDKEGNVNNIRLSENSPSKVVALYEEAARIIKRSSGKWNAGEQNGQKVKSYHQQGIKFVLPSE